MLATVGRVVLGATERVEATAVWVIRPFARRVIALALSETDLTALVRENIDLDALLTDVDLDKLLRRIDVADIAERVLQTVDLAAIVRESADTMTSEAIQGVRLRGSQADQAIGRTVDRLLRRRPLPIG